MPVLMLYLLKLSVGLAMVFLLYSSASDALLFTPGTDGTCWATVLFAFHWQR